LSQGQKFKIHNVFSNCAQRQTDEGKINRELRYLDHISEVLVKFFNNAFLYFSMSLVHGEQRCL